MEGLIQVISRHMEGQETSDSNPHQGKLQNIWPFAHIPMYMGLGVISTYIDEKGFKSHVCNVSDPLTSKEDTTMSLNIQGNLPMIMNIHKIEMLEHKTC